MSQRAPVLAASVVLGATVYLFFPLLWGAVTGAPRFFEWDVPEQYWPDLVYLCRSLHRGAVPYWNPYDRGGYPSYADPQAGTFHPLNWGICAVAGPDPGMAWAELRVVLGFLCAGGFGLLWLRRLGASWLAATVGAVVIECAPFMRHNWELNLTFAMGFLPMVLWALEGGLQDRRPRDAALLALASGLLVWSGSPPVMWLAGSFTFVYAIARCIELRTSRDALLAALRMLALAGALTLGLSAVVLVPSLTLSGLSVQAGRSYESIAEGGLSWLEASALVWPRDGNHLYVGWLALALAPLAALRTPKLPAAPAFAVLAVLAVLMALGDHGPLFGAAFELVPGVRLFRLPHRYEAWLGPAFGALAAGGLDVAVAGASKRWPRLEAPRVALALTALLPLLVLLDVTRRMPDDRHTRGGDPPTSEANDARVLARAEARGYRVMDEFAASCRAGTRLGRRELRGYQDPLLLHAFERAIASLREHPALAEQLNVRYALTGPHFIHGWDRHFLPPPEALLLLPGAIDRGDGVIELTRALPMAYVVPLASVERVPSREAALARTLELAPAPIAILEGSASGARAPAELVPAEVLGYGSDAMDLRAHAETDAVLVVNETWYPGWTATVDGASVEVERANGLVRALPLGPGDHDVHLRFLPPDGAPLRWLWAASGLLALALLFVPRGRSGTSREAARP